MMIIPAPFMKYLKRRRIMHKWTREQKQALHNIFMRDERSVKGPTITIRSDPRSYLTFRRTAYHSHMGCVMVPWSDMWLGIEPDGYTHS